MKKILVHFLLFTLLLSSAHADIYSDLEPGVVSVTAQDTIPFRTEPTYTAEPVLQIGSGVEMTLLSIDEASNWAYVQLESGPDGYPICGYVRPGVLMNGDYLYWNMFRVVNPEKNHRLNLRSEPSADSSSLGKYYTGVYVENYEQEKNGYLRVKVGTRVGYMDKRYLVAYNSTDASAIPMTTIQNQAGSGGNLRKTPSLDGKLYALYPNGTEVAVLGVTPNGWCHVMINGVTGFMMANKLADSFSFNVPVSDPSVLF